MLKIWFMYDNHTFARIRNGDKSSLVSQVRALFDEDGCGSIFVRDEGGAAQLKALTLQGTRKADGKYGVTTDEIERWADMAVIEDSFRHRMHA